MALWVSKYNLTKEEVAQILQDFLDGTGNPWAWDDFTLGMTLVDTDLDTIRIKCLGLGEEFPPENRNEYCNERGRQVMRDYVRQLRAGT